ncbi:hypothetical protein, partial [Alkalimonas amylolytica]
LLCSCCTGKILGEQVFCSPMTIRTPSSLKWLIDKYQKQCQQLTAVEDSIAELTVKREVLRDCINSLAKVIEIHEVPISAVDIPPLRKNTKRTNLAYGLVTKLIYKYLGLLPVDQDASVSEFFYFILEQSGWHNYDPESIRLFRKAVRQRLQNMAYQGKLQRTQFGSHHSEARYRAKK